MELDRWNPTTPTACTPASALGERCPNLRATPSPGGGEWVTWGDLALLLCFELGEASFLSFPSELWALFIVLAGAGECGNATRCCLGSVLTCGRYLVLFCSHLVQYGLHISTI